MIRSPSSSSGASSFDGKHLAESLLWWAAAALLGLRLWTSFCFFPLAEWNLVRLAPTFMLRAGVNPYAGIDAGALSTWIYGPVPLLINFPATLADNAIAACLVGDGINLACTVMPIAVVAAFTVKSRLRSDLAWVLLLALAIWPNSALHYFQADNVATCLGLLSNVLLWRASPEDGFRRAIAGLLAVLAVWSKQTTAALLLAQVIWLAYVGRSADCVRYIGIVVGWFVALAACFTAWFSLDALFLNLVVVPHRIPLCSDVADRTLLLWPHIVIGVVLPLAGAIAFRRHVWRRDSEWLLPVLTCLCMLPLGIAASYKAGGASNSLHGYLFLVIPAASALVSRLKSVGRIAHPLTAAIVVGVALQQMGGSPRLPLRPVTTHLEEAGRLAAAFPGRIYFPWHPLATWFSERRFYHAEDGLYTREIAGFERKPGDAARELPAGWSITAIPGWREDGVFRQLQPTEFQRAYYGQWTLHMWPGPVTETQAKNRQAAAER